MRLNNLLPLTLLVPSLALFGCGDDVKEATTQADGTGTDDEVGPDSEDSESSSSGSESSSSSEESETAESSESETAESSESETAESSSSEESSESETADTETDMSDTETDMSDTETETTETTDTESDTDMEFCMCADNTDLIYVISDDSELWSFDPETNMFDQITPSLGCPQNQTFSMSVDRNGIAHVMFQNDDIYTIDVNNPNMCADPGYAPGQMGFNKFGMGFVSNSQFDPCDKLYAHSWNGQGGFTEGPNAGRLGVLDPETLTMDEIGFINYNGGELTGTGDGRLFAFAGQPAKLVEYDKTNAQVIATEQLNMNLTNAFAFAFYGGDFYMFTESNGNPLVSKVTHYDYDETKMLTTVVPTAPIRIVGAGVSTCVPLAQ